MKIVLEFESLEDIQRFCEEFSAYRRKEEEIEGEKIENLQLTIRTEHNLIASGVFTIKDLCAKTEHEILCMSGIGRISLREIKDVLAHRDLTLRGLALMK